MHTKDVFHSRTMNINLEGFFVLHTHKESFSPITTIFHHHRTLSIIRPTVDNDGMVRISIQQHSKLESVHCKSRKNHTYG